MHVQQQSLNICNTAIIGNHYDTINKNKNIKRYYKNAKKKVELIKFYCTLAKLDTSYQYYKIFLSKHLRMTK